MATPDATRSQGSSLEPPTRKRKASPSLTENVKLAGRGIRKLVALYTPVATLIAEYDRRHNMMMERGLIEEEIDPADPRAAAIKAERDRDFRSVNELFKLLPDLINIIEGTQDTPRLQDLYSQLQEGGNDARSVDVFRARSAVADWLNDRVSDPNQPRLNRTSREGRGLQNNMTGRLLCSLSLDWDNLTVRAKVQNFEDEEHYFGKDFYPRCLYLGEDGDPERVEDGYLKSALLVKTFKIIFTSPSSASEVLDDPSEQERSRHKGAKGSLPRRAHVATLLGMNQQVTPRSIAYAAVQLHFALQTASQWCPVYDDFDYEEFYNFIVDYFEADTSPAARNAARELLNWWNDQVFPNAAPSRAGKLRPSATAASMRVLKQQRTAAT